MKRYKAVLIIGALGAALFPVAMHAYSTYAKWSSNPTFFLNPANADVSATAAEEAIQVGLNAWNTQSGSSFHGNYGGRVSDTSTGYDSRNVVIFRNVSNGGTIATTYSWWSNSGLLLDSDIIFWDGGFTFFTDASGCAGGAYIEDIAAHELGHALGLNHSSDGDATMYPSYSTCSQEMRTLASDDIAGAQSLYPGGSGGGGGGGGGGTNTAPIVSIANPGNWTSVSEGTSLSFSGWASDAEEGNLSSSLIWTSSRDGQIGSDAGFAMVLSVGTHIVTASATDSGGLAGSSQVNVTVNPVPVAAPAPNPTNGRSATARGYKTKGLQKVELRWAGFTFDMVDIYRNGSKISTTSNDLVQTDPINRKGSGTYRYQVCEAGTAECSNEASVTF